MKNTKVNSLIKSFVIKAVICAAIILILLLTLPFANLINRSIKRRYDSLEMLEKGELLIHFIDVGEGDCIAINFPNGEVALIDTGTTSSSIEVLNYLKQQVYGHNYSKTINYLFLSHSDTDHTGGALPILNYYDVENVYRSRQYIYGEDLPDSAYQIIGEENYIKLVNKLNSEIQAGNVNFEVAKDGQIIKIGDATLKIFYPIENIHENNDFSYMIKLEYNNHSVLFTGDATKAVEQSNILRYGGELQCDVLKVAHHGSDSSSSKDFINLVSPKFAVISVGANFFGHPAASVISNLQKVNATILRTDIEGNIVFNLSHDDIFYLKTAYYSNAIRVDFVEAILVLIALDIIIFAVYLIKFLISLKKINRTNGTGATSV